MLEKEIPSLCRELALHEQTDEAIVPPLLERYHEPERRARRAEPRMPSWLRVLLLVMCACWVTVFVVAASLDPYFEDGTPRVMETHRQLGLPPCTFKTVTGLPCPSCGMTTSFALLIHGDVWNSLQANFAGTALATFGLIFIPWSLASVTKGRLLLFGSLEMLALHLSIWLLVLIFGRWGLALLMIYTGRANP